MDEGLLDRWVRSADAVIAADGAANRLFKMSVPFQAVVGDMDSVEAWALSATEVVHLPDQDSTDCDKLLAFCVTRGYSSITLAGVEGNLPDHVLAILHSCLRTPLQVRLAYRGGIGWVMGPESQIKVSSTAGARVSLLPLLETSHASLSGVSWPVSGAEMSPQHFSSISNCATGSEVEASIGAGGALLFVGYERDAMPFWED